MCGGAVVGQTHGREISLAPDDNVVDWNVNKLHKESNESHDDLFRIRIDHRTLPRSMSGTTRCARECWGGPIGWQEMQEARRRTIPIPVAKAIRTNSDGLEGMNMQTETVGVY